MRTYNQPHAYYCGVDLHARSLYVYVLDDAGRTRFVESETRHERTERCDRRDA